MAKPDEKSIITVTPPSRLGQPDIKFKEGDFDFAVFDKGLELIWEKAVPCPCKVKGSQGGLSTCKNCGGIGWVFVNPTRTRMMVQSLDLKTQFKVWGSENPGTVMITPRREVQVSFMDRLTISDTETIFKQVLYPVKNTDGNYIGVTIYPLVTIQSLFLFQSPILALRKLVEGIDYTFSYNVITLGEEFSSLTSVALTVIYTHNIQYHIIESLKDVRNTYTFDSVGKDLLTKMPVYALGRRVHQVLDIENLTGTRLFDNSFTE